MKKLSLLLALCMLLTVGGVYAAWTYIDSENVADSRLGVAMNLTGVGYSSGYGEYEITKNDLSLMIDPKAGTSHTTSLVITGSITITFTPNPSAPSNVKDYGIPSTFQFEVTSGWTFDDGKKNDVIVTLNHPGQHDILPTNATPGAEQSQWIKDGDVFVLTLTAADLADHIKLTDFELDTKTLYDAFDLALEKGQIALVVSDGIAG